MPDPEFTQYKLREVTIDGPTLADGDEASIRLFVIVEAHDPPALRSLRVTDWAGPWREPHNAIPNPLGDACRELRQLRAKWAAKGVSIRGNSVDDALEVTHGTSRVPIHALEAPVHLRALPRRSGA